MTTFATAVKNAEVLSTVPEMTDVSRAFRLFRSAVEREALGSTPSCSYHVLVMEECKSVCVFTCGWTLNNPPTVKKKMKHSPLAVHFMTQVFV